VSEEKTGGVVGKWRSEIAASKKLRDTLMADWRENVNFRVQKPYGPGEVKEDRIAVPEDWARTRQKKAQLMFQVPKVVLSAKRPDYAPAAPIFQAVLNHKLHHEIKAEVMLDECLSDVVNAAGLMVSKVGIQQVTEMIEMPEVDVATLPPEQQLAMLQVGGPKMIEVPKVIYQCFKWDRISPGAFLWPAAFTGSNWDDAPWLGHESFMLLEEAKKTFTALPPDFTSETSSRPDLLSKDILSDSKTEYPTGYVKVQEIFYKCYLYDPASKHPEHIKRIVFVEGHDEPVVHEDFQWQEYVDPQMLPEETNPETGEVVQPAREVPGHYVGVRKFPIRVATLDYVSDLATPPSDSQAGRTQVRELSRSRSQMLRQRDRSIPIRWFDTNRLDAAVIAAIEAGEWQDLIPVNGPGERVIGEVARAQYPRENFTFQSIINSDLDRSWSLSNNQLASQSDNTRSATEANIIQSAANIRLEYEKARVNRYVVEGTEVLAGLVQLFADETDYVELTGADGAKRMAAWDRKTVQGEFAFDIVPDSGDRLDPSVRQERVLKLYNLAANDPTINRPMLTQQLVESYGMDPAVVMQTPPEQQPEPPNISYRFSGEDMLNPMAVAMLIKSGQAPGAEEIKAAALMIKDAMQQIQIAQPPPEPLGGAPGEPPAPGQEPVEPPETVNPILKRANDGSRLM